MPFSFALLIFNCQLSLMKYMCNLSFAIQDMLTERREVLELLDYKCVVEFREIANKFDGTLSTCCKLRYLPLTDQAKWSNYLGQCWISLTPYFFWLVWMCDIVIFLYACMFPFCDYDMISSIQGINKYIHK